MDIDEINYRVLREIQKKEQNSPKLSKINAGFYEALSGYIKNLKSRQESESDNQKKMLLNDEVQNMIKISREIYENREKKIVLASISKARGGNPDIETLENSEKQLFDSLLNLLVEYRDKLFEKKPVQKTKIKNKISEDAKPEIDNTNTNPIILITKDLPEFIGTDTKRYNLRKNDIVSLPNDMADMLSKRKAAKKLER